MAPCGGRPPPDWRWPGLRVRGAPVAGLRGNLADRRPLLRSIVAAPLADPYPCHFCRPPCCVKTLQTGGVYPHSLPTPAGELLNAVARVDEPFLPEDEVSVPPHLSRLEADAPARLFGLHTLRPCSPGGGILMGAASAAVKPLRSLSVGGEHNF
jgi:hypothetical protein